RRSRAGQQALQALQSLDASSEPQPSGAAAAILIEYLRQHLRFATLEPTPQEVAAFLERLGICPEGIDRAGRFFEDGHAASFGPRRLSLRRDWTRSAVQLLEEWEEELQAASQNGAEQHTSASWRSAALLSLLAILPGRAGSLLAGAGLPDAELLDRAAQTFRQAQVLQAGTEQARRLFLVAAASYAELE